MDSLSYATNLAIIENGIVINIIWGYFYNTSFLKDGQNIIPINDLKVEIGDTYRDGQFYHNDEQVKTITESYEDMLADLVDIIYEEGFENV